MQQDVAILIIILTAIVMGTVIALELIKTWRAARRTHIEDGGGREVALLASENAGMKGQMSRLEERIAVLEQIATDPAHRTAREIEELR